jgi:cyclase
MSACTDPWATGRLDATLDAALGQYPVPAQQARENMLSLFRHLHRLNILATYRACEASAGHGAAA